MWTRPTANGNRNAKRNLNARRARRAARTFEALETRTLFANVLWDGGPTGNGTNFLDPVNWASDSLPTALDTAIIGATGTSPNIAIPSGTPAVQNIQSSRN